MPRTLTESPSRHVGHLVAVRPGEGALADQTGFYYQSFPVPVRRPEKGAAVFDIRCDFCDAPLRLRLDSRSKTFWARRGWLALSAAGLLVLVWVILDVRNPDSVVLQTAALMLFSILVAVVSVFAIIAGLVYYWFDDGARLLATKSRGTHKLLYPTGDAAP